MNLTAVRTLVERLPAGIVHPGDPARDLPPTPLPLPGLSGTGIPPEMAKHFADAAGLPSSDAAQLLAEAIVSCIENEVDGGSEIISKTELAALRQAAADAPAGTRVIAVHCICDTMQANPIFELTIGKDNRVITDVKPLMRAVGRRSIDCPHVVTDA